MINERKWVVIHPDTQEATLIWAETEEEAWDKYAKATGIDVSLDEMWKWNSWELIAIGTEIR
jgi:hypothetical protein